MIAELLIGAAILNSTGTTKKKGSKNSSKPSSRNRRNYDIELRNMKRTTKANRKTAKSYQDAAKSSLF
jgi:hypothetical protein